MMSRRENSTLENGKYAARRHPARSRCHLSLLKSNPAAHCSGHFNRSAPYWTGESSPPHSHSAMHRQRDNASSIPNDLQPPSWIQKLQMQEEQEERHSQLNAKHGVAASGPPPSTSDQLPPASRPQPIVAFAALPKHGNILRQQLQRLKDEVALLQVLSRASQHRIGRPSLI